MNKIVQSKKYRRNLGKIGILFVALFFTFSSQMSYATYLLSSGNIELLLAQKTITLSLKNKPLQEILTAIKKQSGVGFAIDEEIKKELGNLSIDVKNVTVDQAIATLLKETPYDYKIVNNQVVFRRKEATVNKTATTTTPQKNEKISINGRVLAKTGGAPIVGATVLIIGTNEGAITDDKGNFTINAKIGSKINVSFVGCIEQTLEVENSNPITISLENDAMKVDDVVVTGYFNKTKLSSTGSQVVVKGEDLRQVGSLNFLTAISVFDPSVRMMESNEFGSDPNRVPELTIRGENGFDLRGSADDSQSNPNAPMYILDGLEVSATRVYDLDMNRVESFTILKDASATSLYGSRGANGVILIQTVAPRVGELKVSVNANFNISTPDLRDYNLMNSREKLAYEKYAGVYNEVWGSASQETLNEEYNNKLKDIARGVDTYWLSRPLKTSVNQRYNLFIEGGDESFRYGIDLKYDTDKGVMKGSGREKIGGTVNFNYNVNRKLYIINDLTVNDVTGENSPYGAFSNFAVQNPYERTHNRETGDIIRRYDYSKTVNPLLDAEFPNNNIERYTEIQDNLSIDWRVNDHFRINGRVGLTKKISKTEIYRSPLSSEFDIETDVNKRGSYTTTNESQLNLDGNVTLAYNNTFKDKITLSAGVGSNMTTVNKVGEGFTATGFLNDNMSFAQYALQYKENTSPSGSFDRSRMVGFFANLNVGYENKYFIDASFRTDGSSRFGRDSRFAPFWSIGGAWNINKEEWWTSEVSTMKLRASVGSTGTVNFSADQAITKYKYNADNEYNGIYGATLMGYGNPALKWQNTLQYNLGLDLTVWRNIIVLNVDAYLKQTQNLLLPIDVAPSTGFLKYTENMGSMENKGLDFRLRFNIINNRKQDLNWNVTLAGFHNQNKIVELSNALEAMNEEAYKKENSGFNPNPGKDEAPGRVAPLRIYEVGRSQSALMVVRSMGIDPATGNEIFVKLNGDLTFDYDPRDKIVVGDTNPKFEGNFQSNLTYKGFNLFFVLAYSFGSDLYNETLARKVEGTDPKYNADLRVLTDRWKKPGDVTMFRRIGDMSVVNQSTRLVQKNDFVRLQTLSLSYQVPIEYLKNTFIERCKISANASDLFRISTVKQERGTTYPFAQTFSVGINLTF